MDAFAVSIMCGATITEHRYRHAVRASFSFGLFQGVMPVLGWLVGVSFRNHIVAFDHWVAFGLLGAIGVKMIYDSFHQDCCGGNCVLLKPGTLFMLSIATSIDALIVGVGFALLDVSIIKAAILIGVITFIICLAGFYLGHRTGRLLGGRAEFVGGVILIGLGVKILCEHLGYL